MVLFLSHIDRRSIWKKRLNDDSYSIKSNILKTICLFFFLYLSKDTTLLFSPSFNWIDWLSIRSSALLKGS